MIMKIHRILVGLTIVNLAILVYLVAQLSLNSTAASSTQTGGATTVLRGSALEIVDDQGRVRASIKIQQADPTFKMPDGKTGYPETVMFRLIDPNGRPEVKLGASVKGAGLGLIGETDSTHVLLRAEGADTSLKMTNKDGRLQLLKP